jgi:hypothetical protein
VVRLLEPLADRARDLLELPEYSQFIHSEEKVVSDAFAGPRRLLEDHPPL